MKFGRRLQEEAYEPYQPHYIAYKELKKAIKLITGSDVSNYTISEVSNNFGHVGGFIGSSQRPPEARFQELLNFEVDKINSFSTLVYTSIVAGLQSVLKRLPNVTTLEVLDGLIQEAESSSDGSSYLHAYVQLNLMGFRKITKKYDKHSRGTSSSWYLARVVKEQFVNLNFDYLIELISVCFAEIRRCRRSILHQHRSQKQSDAQLKTDEDFSFKKSYIDDDEEDNDDDNCGDVDMFQSNDNGSLSGLPEMTNTTYLVAEDNIMPVRIHLAKHLPLAALGTVKCPSKTPSVVKELIQGIPRRHRETQKKQTNTSDKPMNTNNNSKITQSSESNLQRGGGVDNDNFPQPTRATVPESHNNDNDDIASAAVALEEESGRFTNPAIYKHEQHRVSHGCLYFDNPETLEGYRNLLSNSKSTTLQCGRNNNECLRLRWEARASFDLRTPVILEISKPEGPAVSANEWFDLTPSNNSNPIISNAAVLNRIDIEMLLSGSLNIVEWAQRQNSQRTSELTSVLTRAATMIHDKQYVPIWHTWCHRTSYRRLTKQRPVFAYLDENVRFLDWDSKDSLTASLHDSSLLSSYVETCPFGVLSLSLPTSFKPGFLPNLTGLTTVSEIWMYSRFFHGTSILRRKQLEFRELPHWYRFITTSMNASSDNNGTLDLKDRDRKGKKQGNRPNEATRVDVMTTHPRERVMHEHLVTTKQEERLESQQNLNENEFSNQGVVAHPSSSAAVYATEPQRKVLVNRESLKEPLLLGAAPPYTVQQQGFFNTNAPSSSSARALALSADDAGVNDREGRLINRIPGRQFLIWISAMMSSMVSKVSNFFQPPPALSKVGSAAVRVEPKTFFANERTLLQWMNTAVLLSTISITLLNFGTPSGHLAGLILAPVALFFIVYSFVIYLRRSYCLERKEPINYNDRVGPTILVVCLIAALSAIIILNIVNNEMAPALHDVSSSTKGSHSKALPASLAVPLLPEHQKVLQQPELINIPLLNDNVVAKSTETEIVPSTLWNKETTNTQSFFLS